MFQNFIKYLSIIFCFCFFLSTNSKAIIIKKIDVQGNSRVSDNTIVMFSDIAVNDNVEINDINVILKKIYESNFFDNVNVVLKDDILIIEVIEKPIIESINYTGIKSNELLSKIKLERILKPRSSYDKIFLKKDRQNILNSLNDKGFYFSKVETSIIDLGENKIDINIDVITGEKSKIKKISFIGDKKFKNKKLRS